MLQPACVNSRLTFIGFRARDSPDDDEKEILSSTSPNVREIWNGNRVVRQTGESKTKEYFYLTAWDLPGIAPNSVILAVQESSRGILYPCQFRSFKAVGDSEQPGEHGSYIAKMLANKAPNLTLNIERAIPEGWKVWLFLSIGILIQLGALTINAFVVYYWRWLRAGNIVATYGYPVWAIGTTSMTLGVSLCAQVIQTSTVLYTLRPYQLKGPLEGAAFCIQDRIITSNLPGYLILHNKSNPVVHVSKRIWPLVPGEKFEDRFSRSRLLLAYLGTLLTLVGFICQNIGTRELHWSAGVFQLGATLLLVLIRAWLRRHIGDDPCPKPIPLVEGLEATQVAAHLKESNFSMLCDFLCDWPDEIPDYLNATKLFQKGEIYGYASIVYSGADNVGSNYSINHSERAAFDTVYNMIGARKGLLKFYPSNKKATEIASAVCGAMFSVLDSVLPPKDPRPFEWSHYTMVTGLNPKQPLRGVVPFIFTMRVIETLRDSTTQNVIEALISFSLYFCYHTEFDYDGNINRILNSCTRDQLDGRFRQMQAIRGRPSEGWDNLVGLTRNADGKLLQERDTSSGVSGLVIGLRSSSLFSDQKVPLTSML